MLDCERWDFLWNDVIGFESYRATEPSGLDDGEQSRASDNVDRLSDGRCWNLLNSTVGNSVQRWSKVMMSEDSFRVAIFAKSHSWRF